MELEHLLRRLENKSLVEGHHVEFKAPNHDWHKIAREVAGMALGGGTLYIGVTDSGDIAPVKGLHRYREDLQHALRDSIRPPVYFTMDTSTDPNEPDDGVLILTIPPSSLAPHMAGGRYWGRHDTSTQELQDREVEIYMNRRETRYGNIRADLMRWVERAPERTETIRKVMGDLGHMWVVASPTTAQPKQLLDVALRESPNHVRWVGSLLEKSGLSDVASQVPGRRLNAWYVSDFATETREPAEWLDSKLGEGRT